MPVPHWCPGWGSGMICNGREKSALGGRGRQPTRGGDRRDQAVHLAHARKLARAHSSKDGERGYSSRKLGQGLLTSLAQTGR
jgi:hypothetical protein